MRKALAAMAIATAALLALAPGAIGGDGFSSRVSLHFKGEAKVRLGAPTFYGRVASEKRACERGRKVVLFGQASGAPAERIDRTRTNRKGRWRIGRAAGYPNYYAEVKRSEIKAGPCRSDLSKPLHVG